MALLFFQDKIISQTTQDTGMKLYSSADPQFKFRIMYPTVGWYFKRDLKVQSDSRFKDIIVITTQNKINQLRLSTYKKLETPNVREVARILEGEFVRDEIRQNEQYFKIKNGSMTQQMIKAAKAMEGWELGFSYWDRREGILYTTFYIYYKKIILPNADPERGNLTIGRAYVIRTVVRKDDYFELNKEMQKIIRSFQYDD